MIGWSCINRLYESTWSKIIGFVLVCFPLSFCVIVISLTSAVILVQRRRLNLNKKRTSIHISEAQTAHCVCYNLWTIGIQIHEASRCEFPSLEVLTKTLSSFRLRISDYLERLWVCLHRYKSNDYKTLELTSVFRSFSTEQHHRDITSSIPLKCDFNVIFIANVRVE